MNEILQIIGQEEHFVSHMYEKYQGRVPVSMAYDQNCSELFPFVFEDVDGHAIGIIAIAVVTENEKERVHIYHISSFRQKIGNGSIMLVELCRQADIFNVILSLSPISMGNGKDFQISYGKLKAWYATFGFSGEGQLRREPV
ncbi:MAG: hypothetical protein KJ737_17315 [Proteobacteria bacterium]|nr:hypothetical protein [Pseudomonadota bacterium]